MQPPDFESESDVAMLGIGGRRVACALHRTSAFGGDVQRRLGLDIFVDALSERFVVAILILDVSVVVENVLFDVRGAPLVRLSFPKRRRNPAGDELGLVMPER